VNFKFNMKTSPILGLAGVALLACGAPHAVPATAASTSAPATRAACEPDRDRAAIRRMAGSFAVTFAFEETEVLTPGYTAKPAHTTPAKELVTVLEDSPRKIVLQHILLVHDGSGKLAPQKHWRQDWAFEDDTVLEFEGRETFATRKLAKEALTCSWSQAVFEVSDAPRYESTGRWVHEGATSTWTSGKTWRPLPRREYTKRSDYDVLIGINRHIVRADGWSHEQDNEKHVLATGKGLVRERGENRYVRATLSEAPQAEEYMHKTSAFWEAVRAEWAVTFAARPRFALAKDVDNKLLYEVLFALADEPPPADRRREGRAAVARYVVDPPNAAARP